MSVTVSVTVSVSVSVSVSVCLTQVEAMPTFKLLHMGREMASIQVSQNMLPM